MKVMLFYFLSFLPLTVFGYELKRVSVHDPSVVWDSASKTYYIFGSHRAAAKTTDMMSWTAFTPTYDYSKYNPAVWSGAYGNYSIDGNQWAPDVIWNKVMQKWCMYLSINGPTWNSSIVLLTSDNIEGPYICQGPIVFSGFNVTSTTGVSYKNTDLEQVIGTQSALPERYNVGRKWGDRWPHCIDPCVFYDEDGNLWMSYGSWSGGIWMLQLDENTGLRDYTVSYQEAGNGNGVTSDPYFGTKIAGGYYVSGEASYIEYIGGWYFLFVTYGGLAAGGDKNDYNNGGYQMRVFRSKKPDGPYLDARDTDAIFTSFKTDFGPSANDNRGVNIFGAYSEWGNQAKGNYGERSQGHNSIIAAEDGRTYLVYHTRFQNRNEEHQVRVHQVFQNEDGWLVAAPFEYTGEQVKSADIATTQQIATDRIPGTYQLLIHPFKLDHTKKEAAKPVEIELHADGTITGESTGSWTIQEGTSYISITLDREYKGVMVEQTLEPSDDKTIAFTALNRNGVTVWGYQTSGTTGIHEVKSWGDNSDKWYNLSGQLVDHPTKGIYIRNGRKVIVR
jgi:arabinan endo-1,5-alpha-L-arabinosidase